MVGWRGTDFRPIDEATGTSAVQKGVCPWLGRGPWVT